MDALIDAFLLGAHRHVQIVGGGGKTTLMLALAAALREAGQPVLVGTSAHILPPPACPALLLACERPDLAAAARGALDRWGWGCVARARDPGTGKLLGLEPEALDALHAGLPGIWLLVEADGSRGRPIKAHAPHEPALSAGVRLVIAVLGLSALGRPLDERVVHRPALLAGRLGVPAGTPLTEAHLAGAADALFARCPPTARRLVFLSQVARGGAGAAIADRLLRLPAPPDRVVWGDLLGGGGALAWEPDRQSSTDTSHS